MFTADEYLTLRATKSKNTFARSILALTTWVKVTVLLSLAAASSVVRANDANRPNVRLFEFTSDFYIRPIGRGRLDGLMACDGSRYRIALYWIEPGGFHDHTFFLGYSDFVFTEDRVHYWIYGMSEGATLNLSDTTEPLLPRDVSAESVARSALAIASRITYDPQDEGSELEVGRFFRHSRAQADYSYEVPSTQASKDKASESTLSDVEILNALPYGRKYSKQTRSDGTLVWRAQRVLDGPHVATVTVRPISDTQAGHAYGVFDPKTLGQWAQMPDTYRAYWSFDQAYSKLKEKPDSIGPVGQLHDEIETYLAKNNVPDRIELAFNRLLFKTALLTADTDCVSRSARALVAALCWDVSVNRYQGLLELARIDVQIREHYPRQADDLICPLIALMVRRAGTDAQSNLKRLMPAIKSNKWFGFGKLLAEQIRVQGLAEENDADSLVTRLEASRLAVELAPYDPFQASGSVKQYLAQLDDNPPKGELGLDDVRRILQKGLAKPFADANMELQQEEIIENVARSIRRIAGQGPFHGDRAKLTQSIERFSWLYLVVDKAREPIDSVLATFLALSFCDVSTPEDHDVLFSQICRLSGEFQALSNSTLSERGLSELVAPSDVKRVFERYEARFEEYIDDPLWPAFKFPLTSNEQARLRNKLKLRFSQLAPLFEEMSLKVKYGGASPQLKQKTIYEISRAAQQLLPLAAFLRNPPYPGIASQYRGGYGFTAVIKGPFYQEGDRPRERFKAMKYFHLGHRLEDVVMRERELARAKMSEAQED